MKCPKCHQDSIGVTVQVSRVLPLAKGGGVNTQGATVTLKDLVAAHQGNLKFWTSPRGRIEPYYEVECTNDGSDLVAEDGTVTHREFCCQPLWYFPSFESAEGKKVLGRSLTWVNGVPTDKPEPSDDPSSDENVEEGYIGGSGKEAEPAVPAAPRRRPAIVMGAGGVAVPRI